MHMSSEFGEDISFCSRVIAFFVKLVHEFECFGSPGFLFSLDQTTAVIFSGLSRSITLKKYVVFCPLVSYKRSFRKGPWPHVT